MMKEELFEFADDAQSSVMPESSWKILVVDDDEEVHAITRAVLKGFVFEGKGLVLIHAHSAKEAKQKLQEHTDTALILLDVVMETDDAGLTFVEYVRNDLGNKLVRIVLRTGQPGQAPQREVVVDLDINDYKEKTELTVDKLFTTVIASIRSYRDLITIEMKRQVIEQNRQGLQQIIEASSSLFEMHSLKDFAKGALTQLISILNLNKNSLYLQVDGLSLAKTLDGFSVLAGTGRFSEYENEKLDSYAEENLKSMLEKVLQEEKSMCFDEVFIDYFKSSNGQINMLDRRLLDIYSSNVAIAFENLYLDKEVLDTQNEVIQTLSEVVESRSKETANHVKRVCEYAYYLAKKSGLDETESSILKFAAPLHDVGKIGIPDNVLLKPGKLTDEEFEIITSHATLGYNILKNSTRPILKAAAIVAHEHHEKYDGTGYPRGLEAREIHIYGRIVAIADVFDALSHRRCYKDAWTFDDAMGYMNTHKGTHFDPTLVDLFFSDIEYVKNIMSVYAENE
jgi:response regulator RpfG family c-di-GMP phosphodiesterase